MRRPCRPCGRLGAAWQALSQNASSSDGGVPPLEAEHQQHQQQHHQQQQQQQKKEEQQQQQKQRQKQKQKQEQEQQEEEQQRRPRGDVVVNPWRFGFGRDTGGALRSWEEGHVPGAAGQVKGGMHGPL